MQIEKHYHSVKLTRKSSISSVFSLALFSCHTLNTGRSDHFIAITIKTIEEEAISLDVLLSINDLPTRVTSRHSQFVKVDQLIGAVLTRKGKLNFIVLTFFFID